ncbi:MAG: ATP-dependent Clp protease ATP-binding subunit [Candidatus Marinimicrobia bacterium]|nr:ATP-dependent Clp protease ATP-binding subunit [Candidatus Neomarinimicrobiota bacterium]MBL7022745.1 ATP-dependent Clp protease ATP-binding subunit [Candidatus Neomarinimicrobiota bacterium]MBL7109616.1 ATP-dependent Clp protease ATP-binding subunit [Candidatus Neomarinimicrobiota bacterium]
MKENFTHKVQLIIKYAKDEAIRLGHNYIGSEHLLLGLIKESQCKAITLLMTLGCDLTEMRDIIEKLTNTQSDTSSSGKTPFTRRSERILRETISEAKKLGQNVANDIHLLLAIALEKEGLAYDILTQYSIDYDLLLTYIGSSKQHKIASKEKTSPSSTPTLDKFSRDISLLAINGHLDPVIGRNIEIERVAQILSRRKKNNPVLIGEPGVGKTAIVEGLAIRILEKTVPRVLWNQRVIVLDIAGLIAGTKYRGQFEERMRALMLELEKASDIIIFIDELHTLVGAGSATGSLDAANMFKPALARGEIQIVGATTMDEYRQYIEKDGALERRFQKIIVNSPSIKDSKRILEGLKKKYEDHHQISYSDESIEACVELSERYITDKFLPDKAIDVMDEVGARVRISNVFVPDSVVKLEKKILELKKSKEKAIIKQKFEEAADLRDQERKQIAKLQNLQNDLNKNETENRPIVTEDEVANVVSMITGIPMNKVAESESSLLLNMAKALKGNIVGQDEAISKLSQSILRARAGFKNPIHPIGSFMFLGPTGVGKTELAKVLAKYLFSDEEALVRIDMSEYMERYNVSRLVGAPPGYIGYEEGGQLTEKVRRNPYSVVLFDEIEKAHRDVFNILLQILDEGRITDSLGRKIDFRNTIIILTSNIGTQNISSSTIGFTSDINKKQMDVDSEILDEVKKIFKPEFLNRLDDLIVFSRLSKENMFKIVDLQLEDIRLNLQSKGVKYRIYKSAKELLIRESDHRQWGARSLRRVIQNRVENVISEKFLKKEFVDGGKIIIKANKEDLTFEQIELTTKKKRKLDIHAEK